MDMDMQTDSHSCKISMLWNWYTVDSCFIARTWHVKSRGAFAGSCIGVFMLVVVSQWLSRFAKEYNAKLNSQLFLAETDSLLVPPKSHSDSDPSYQTCNRSPITYALSHKYLCVPSNWGYHLIKCALFAIEWGLSYFIMLLFMYYNGYIIISCILGAFVGKLIFGFNEPELSDVECCKR